MFNWLLYLELSDKLLLLGSEAGFRSAVSRAYYGIFGQMRNTLENEGLNFHQDNIHQEVIGWLKSHQNMDVRKIGYDLDYLRRERNRSDYNARESFDKSRTVKSIITARLIVENAQKVELI